MSFFFRSFRGSFTANDKSMVYFTLIFLFSVFLFLRRKKIQQFMIGNRTVNRCKKNAALAMMYTIMIIIFSFFLL